MWPTMFENTHSFWDLPLRKVPLDWCLNCLWWILTLITCAHRRSAGVAIQLPSQPGGKKKLIKKKTDTMATFFVGKSDFLEILVVTSDVLKIYFEWLRTRWFEKRMMSSRNNSRMACCRTFQFEGMLSICTPPHENGSISDVKSGGISHTMW